MDKEILNKPGKKSSTKSKKSDALLLQTHRLNSITLICAH